MNRTDKERYLKNISTVLSSYDFLVVANFSGITASESYALRRELKVAGGGMIVAKNTLACIALRQLDRMDFLVEKFVGPVVLVYSNDVVAASKVIASFVKKNKDKLSVQCAAYLDAVLSKEDVVRFASLQSLEQVRLQIMRLLAFNINARLVMCLRYLKEQES